MIRQLAFLLALWLCAPAEALAQSIAGNWQFTTGDLKPANRCTLSGALVLKGSGEPETLSCDLAVRYQCKKGKDGTVLVTESCRVETRGRTIFIRGTSYEIVEADPPDWIDKYYLDTFTLTLSRGGNRMAGRIGSRATAVFDRIKDPAE